MGMKVGINGFGRIGRLVLRLGMERPDIEFVGINSHSQTPDYMAYLLKYDSVHGRYQGEVSWDGAVSYTHLDVYKRQRHHPPVGRAVCGHRIWRGQPETPDHPGPRPGTHRPGPPGLPGDAHCGGQEAGAPLTPCFPRRGPAGAAPCR